MTKDVFYLPPNDPDLERDYITGSEYQSGTRTAVRTISSDFDTDVIFQGQGACTDGKFVVLPQQDQDAMMTYRQVYVGRGYANHESLHKQLTDFKTGLVWMKKMTDSGRGFTKHLSNAIEDVRIENGGKHLYGGMAKSIDKTAEEVCRVFAEQHADEAELNDPWKMLPLAVTWIGRVKLGYPSPVIKQAFENLGEDVKRRAILIADAVINGLEHGVEGVGQVNIRKAYKGCRDGMKLAERFADELRKELPPTPPTTKPSEGDPEDDGEGELGTPTSSDKPEGEEGDTKTKGGGAGGGADEEEGEKTEAPGETEEVTKTTHGNNDVNEPTKDGDEGSSSEVIGHGASEKPQEETLQPEPIPLDHELGQIKEMLSNHQTSKDGTISLIHNMPFTTADDVIEEPTHATQNASHFREEYHKAKRAMGSKLATMRRKLERALIAKVDVDRETSTSGRLNVRGKASGIIMGANKIYTKRVQGEAIDTAVTMLIDCSGSMRGDPMMLAGHSAIAMSEALEAGGVPYEVIGHTTTSMSTESNRAFNKERQTKDDVTGLVTSRHGWARECALYMPVFKPFNKALRQCYHSMGMIMTSSDNSNADACAIREAGLRLMKRPERKKVLMLLADGYPAWTTALDRVGRDEYTRESVVNLEAQGVNCIGIGIADDCVKQFFERWVMINSVDDLSKTVLDQIAKLIISERFTVDTSDLIGGDGGLRTHAS